MATRDLAERLKLELESLLEYRALSIAKPPPNRDQENYEMALSSFESLMSAASDLYPLPLEYLPDKVAKVLIEGTPRVTNLLQSIKGFDLEDQNSSHREALYRDLYKAADGLLEVASPFIPYLAYRQSDSETIMARFGKATDTTVRKLNETSHAASQKLNEIDTIIEKAKDASAFSGTSAFSEYFEQESNKLWKQSIGWIAFTVLFGGLTIYTAANYVFGPVDSAAIGNWEEIRGTFSKATILAVFFSASVWCGRNYRALMHQVTVNRHRSLSLKTFMAFVLSTEDPHARDAVLLAATKSVFGFVPSGFINHSTNDTPDLSIVELGRSTRRGVADAAKSSGTVS